MAVQKSEFAPAGVLLQDLVNRPEPSEAEREALRSADRINFDEAQKEFGLIEEDFMPADFPRALGRTLPGWCGVAAYQSSRARRSPAGWPPRKPAPLGSGDEERAPRFALTSGARPNRGSSDRIVPRRSG
jgi:hypothetical protein